MTRWLHKLRTRRGGFWLPCVICGEPFGSHEKPAGWLLEDAISSTMTCPRCPGFWIRRDGRYVQLNVALDDRGEPYIRWVFASSEWPASVNTPR